MTNPGTWREEVASLPGLLRGEVGDTPTEACHTHWRGILIDAAIIFVGVGIYGAAAGCWRSPLQAFYLSLKLPLIVLITTFANALINGMLAPLLGLNVPLRQSLRLVMMSFKVMALILASFSPLALFLVWNMASPKWGTGAAQSVYYTLVLVNVILVAIAGVSGVVRLHGRLRSMSDGKVAMRVLIAWLAGNLFLGAQVSWLMRPFIGSPDIEVQFLRLDALEGNFYESVFLQLKHFLGAR